MQKNKNTIEFRNGFSLIELMVVLAIAFIMTGLLYSTNIKNSGSNDVQNAATQIVSDIRALQNGALTGKMISNSNICRFGFSSSNGNSSYKLSYDKNCSGAQALVDNPIVDVSNLHVKLGNSALTFIAPYASVSPQVNTTLTITSLKDASFTKNVVITATGDIYIQ